MLHHTIVYVIVYYSKRSVLAAPGTPDASPRAVGFGWESSDAKATGLAAPQRITIG